MPRSSALNRRTLRLLTVEQAADRLNISTKSVRRYIASGRLTGYRVGPTLVRVDADEVDELVRPIPTARPKRKTRQSPPNNGGVAA